MAEDAKTAEGVTRLDLQMYGRPDEHAEVEAPEGKCAYCMVASHRVEFTEVGDTVFLHPAGDLTAIRCVEVLGRAFGMLVVGCRSVTVAEVEAALAEAGQESN